MTSFELIQQASDAGSGGLIYFAFDLLELNGEDVASFPLLDRKERLATLLKSPPAGIVYSDVFFPGAPGPAQVCRYVPSPDVARRMIATMTVSSIDPAITSAGDREHVR